MAAAFPAEAEGLFVPEVFLPEPDEEALFFVDVAVLRPDLLPVPELRDEAVLFPERPEALLPVPERPVELRAFFAPPVFP